jgi:diguanylate cyclase (GGDEF)-like protein
MQPVLISASLLLLIAIVWSFALLRRLRDWRAAFVLAWLAASMLLLVLAIAGQLRPASVAALIGPGKLQQLAISGLTMAAVMYFHVAFQRDALTGLPNRALIMHRLGRALARVHRGRDATCAVLFLDVDRFKVVNDSLGHTRGDQMLVSVAQRLQSGLRKGDYIGRLGGDEFVVILHGEDEDGAVRVAQRLHEVLARPIPMSGRDVFTGVSIGIAISARGDEGAESLLRAADLAMYRAKIQGKSRHVIFKPSMQVNADERLELESDLQRAANSGEFVLYYQPIISLTSGTVCGVEALVRWQHRERGLLLPDSFVAVAEETGLIVVLDLWVLEEACQQMRSWQDSFPGARDMLMHVNLSGRQFLQAGLVERVAEILERTELPAESLGLEMTETVLMNDAELATTMLSDLRTLGVKLQLDDFGTGYSSLAYLHRFPIDSLKIDRSFVMEMGANGDDSKIVHSINALARDLELEVIAEGIETAEQLTMLRAMGCHYGQGNFLCEPMDAALVGPLLSRGRLATERAPRWKRDASTRVLA